MRGVVLRAESSRLGCVSFSLLRDQFTAGVWCRPLTPSPPQPPPPTLPFKSEHNLQIFSSNQSLLQRAFHSETCLKMSFFQSSSWNFGSDQNPNVGDFTELENNIDIGKITKSVYVVTFDCLYIFSYRRSSENGHRGGAAERR